MTTCPQWAAAARTACPAARTNTTSSIDRLLRACAIGALLVAAQPGQAQDRNSDADLEALIPDAAIDDPAAWAGAPPPGTQAQAVTPDVDADLQAPLADDGFALAWPDGDVDIPTFADLAPDPDVETVLAEAIDLPERQRRQGDEVKVSSRVTLVFPQRQEFSDRDQFEQRFRDLSAIEEYEDEGDDSLAQLAARARSDRELLLKLLRIEGYYDAWVYQTVGGQGAAGEGEGEGAGGGGGDAAKPGEDGRNAKIRFDIQPGPRYRFGKIDLARLEDTGSDYADLRKIHGIEPGDPVDSDRIVAQRGALDIALGESGYPFAKTGEPELLVDHAREEGDLTQPVTPGGKYAFGGVVSSLPRFLSNKHLEEIARFESGDLYKRSEMDDLRRAVLATGLVSSVTVTPREMRAPAAGQPGEVAIDVGLAKAPLRTIAGAIGYDSQDGPRVEASWEHRNMFPPEGKLQLRGILGTKEQLAGISFRRNNFKGRDQVLTADLYASTVNRTAYEARTVALSASFEKLTTLIFQKKWTWSAGFELLATNEREGDVGNVAAPRSTYYIGALPVRLAYDGSDNLLDPTKGFRASLRLSPEVSYQRGGSKHVYGRILADASYYQPVSERIVLAARARLGSIPGTSIEHVAPSRRFYAGGGGSVRGYGYQLIGPRDTLGDPSGGRSLSEFSLEARVKTGLFGGALSVVPFLDAGAVDETATPRLRDVRYGAGLGVRYATGFGPLRVDIGTPLNPRQGDSRIAVYISLGQAF